MLSFMKQNTTQEKSTCGMRHSIPFQADNIRLFFITNIAWSDFDTIIAVLLLITLGEIVFFSFKNVWYSKTQKMLKFTFNALIQQQ